MPGSLTAYDMGRLEIESLRKEAQTKLGESFDLRAFDEEVIEEDGVPLPELRRSMELWIEQRIPGRPLIIDRRRRDRVRGHCPVQTSSRQSSWL